MSIRNLFMTQAHREPNEMQRTINGYDDVWLQDKKFMTYTQYD